MYKDDFEQHFLVDLHEFLVPIIDICGLFITRVILLFLNWIVLMMIRPFKNLPVISHPNKGRQGEWYLLENIHSYIVEGDRTGIICDV